METPLWSVATTSLPLPALFSSSPSLPRPPCWSSSRSSVSLLNDLLVLHLEPFSLKNLPEPSFTPSNVCSNAFQWGYLWISNLQGILCPLAPTIPLHLPCFNFLSTYKAHCSYFVLLSTYPLTVRHILGREISGWFLHCHISTLAHSRKWVLAEWMDLLWVLEYVVL